MSKHEFGIMQIAPQKGKRYDEYESQKYDCISVNDDYIEKIVSAFDDIDFYWHSLDVPGKGLSYCGITLIPPSSMQTFISIIKKYPELSELTKLLEKAFKENKWVIHYGL